MPFIILFLFAAGGAFLASNFYFQGRLDTSKELIGIKDVQQKLKEEELVKCEQRLQQATNIGSQPAKSNEITLTWAIVIQTDQLQKDAEDNKTDAESKKYENVNIYKTEDGLYKTAVMFRSSSDASRELKEIKGKFRDSAFKISLKDLCPNPQPQQVEGYFECLK